jgi:hypothetical protein
MVMKKYFWVVIFLFSWLPTVHSAVVYQDFERDNGTPSAAGASAGADGEYGWGFNGVAVELNDEKDYVHSKKRSWKITIPAGEPVHAGSAVPAQVQTYQVNFIPECHDRLTFWIWAEPSNVGDHTTMIKFFDQGAYKQQGVGIWTTEPAKNHQWTQLTVLFSQLPADFNLHRVDKIEFFNYWDGTYYFDDIEIHSPNPDEADVECLKKEQYLSCLDLKSEEGSTPVSGDEISSLQDGARTLNPILGATSQEASLCHSVFSTQADFVLDASQIRAQRRAEGLALMEQHESR